MYNTKILFWNYQDIVERCTELLNFVQEHNICILLLNETHLTNNRHFKLPKFFSYYTNTPRIVGYSPSAGTTILINIHLIHYYINILITSLTNTVVHVNLGNSELRLVAVYKSPNTPFLTSDFDALFNSTTDTIIVGELNSKHCTWNNQITNSSEHILHNYLNRIEASVP